MTTDAVGGAWNYTVALVGGLQAIEPSAIHVTLVCMGPPPNDHQRAALDQARAHVELLVHETKLEWMDGCEQDLVSSGEWLLELERQRQPDVVHLNSYAHASLPWRAPAMLVAHSCVLSWWQAVHRTPAPARWDNYRRRVRTGLRRARAVVATTEWMLARLREHYDVPFEARVIPNGLCSPEFALPNPKSPMILAAGRLWDLATNLGSLDAVAEQLPWPVRVADDGSGSSSSGPRRMESLGLLTPSELAWWMSHASIFAHPALYEPFGLAPLQAARSGCVLVLGDIPSLRELWHDAAVFVKPRDRDALAAALLGLIDDPVRRDTLAAAANARAGLYSVERTVTAYGELYRDLARPQ